MACIAYLVVSISYVSSCQKPLWEEALIAGTKQSRQADKAGRPTRQAGRQGRQADKAGRPTMQAGRQGSGACQLCFVPATSALVLLKWIFYKLICLEQSTSLGRYLWCCCCHGFFKKVYSCGLYYKHITIYIWWSVGRHQNLNKNSLKSQITSSGHSLVKGALTAKSWLETWRSLVW